eukprot:SAG11_NODE_382_length_9923_cov_29.276771_5_plen_88_part_00
MLEGDGLGTYSPAVVRDVRTWLSLNAKYYVNGALICRSSNATSMTTVAGPAKLSRSVTSSPYPDAEHSLSFWQFAFSSLRTMTIDLE